MSKQFKDVIVEIKNAYNIVDYIQQSGTNLKSAGVNKYKGLCCFHNEKSASFVVDEHFQNYRCFGCGANGDLIKFVQANENLEFMDAVKKLAEDKGIELEITDSETSIDYKSLRACIKEAALFFVKEFRKLEDSHPAKLEVTKRELSLNKMVYGYAPDGRDKLYKHLSGLGYSDEVILQTGVCMKYDEKSKINDFWHGRLMFVITDITGKPVGFSGRKLFDTDKRGKYVNSTETPLFNKSSVLFNLSRAKKEAGEKKSVIVVEGQFDVASYVEAGAINTVASSGTAFGEKQVMICRRLVSEEGEIIFAFDGDSAGIEAAKKVFRISPLIHGQAYFLTFPEGTDPDDFRINKGSEALIDFTHNKKKPAVEFILDLEKESLDLTSPIDTSKYLQKAARVLKTVTSISLRDVYIKKVALDTFTSVDLIKKMVDEAESLIAEPRKNYTEDDSKVSEDSEVEAKDDSLSDKELELDPEFDSDSVIEMIKKEDNYNISSRLISISLYDPRFTKYLEKTIMLFPKELRPISKELIELKTKSSIFPEAFTHVKLSRFLIEQDFMNNLNTTPSESELKDLWKYLSNELKRIFVYNAENIIRSKIASIIQNSGLNNTEFLEKALEREEMEISKLYKALGLERDEFE